MKRATKKPSIPPRSSHRSGRVRSARTREEMPPLLTDTEMLVISGFWTDAILDLVPHLKLIQPVSTGVDQHPCEALARCGICLCSGQGVNANAVFLRPFLVGAARVRSGAATG